MHKLTGRKTTSFVIATSIVTRFGPGPDVEDGEPEPELTVMFVAGPADNAMARRDTAALAKRTGKNIVFIEFERGAAAKGPRNIVVFEMNDGELTTWPRCTLWKREPSPLSVILPRGSDFAFAYDGVHLRRLTGAPTTNLASGYAAAKTELHEVAGRMTSELFDQIQTVRTQIFPVLDS